jgi:hypothetical protein
MKLDRRKSRVTWRTEADQAAHRAMSFFDLAAFARHI